MVVLESQEEGVTGVVDEVEEGGEEKVEVGVEEMETMAHLTR